MSCIVFIHFKAICLLFRTLFVLLLVLAAASEDKSYFSTKPKDKEVFVGETVQFDWDYVVEDMTEIRFGVVIPDKGNMAIYKKKKDGTRVLNNQDTSVEWIRDRVEIVPNRRASFKVNNVKMKDSVTFFCEVHFGEDKTDVDNVKLSVVDLLIDTDSSTRKKESWVGHKITVVCAVKVPESLEENAMFSWKRIPSNRTVAREFHDDMRSKSYLSIITNRDEDFETLQCKAETKQTVKFHKINITKLSAPSEPRNLKTETVFDKKKAQTYIRLEWDPPEQNGGSKIEKYVIQYIVSGLPWKSPEKAEARGTEYEELKLQNGGKYNARVRAQNKAGLGPPSNEVLINLEDITSQPISDSSHLKHLEAYILLVSVMVWFL